ncbi:MAG TPA: methyltransferase domain-containing protein [Thermoplasmata archaeon]|nr:methyltransferase domain-containing protein [Thermoplasmata archaeon]
MYGEGLDVSLKEGPVGAFPYSFDRVATIYDQSRWLPDEVVARIVSEISGIHPGGRLLEVGVGTGRLSIPLQRAGLPVVGTDVSSQMICLGVKKGARGLLLADALHLPFIDKTIGTAMTNRVLHLLADWRMALREVCRVTRDTYLSVLERESADPDVDAEYSRLVEAAGGETKRPGIYERDLAARLPPEKRIRIGTVTAKVPASEVISMLERRVYSSQWRIPEPSHHEAIESVREQFDGMTVTTRNEVEIVVWSVQRLGGYVDADQLGT